MNPEDCGPSNTPEWVDWPVGTEYPSEINPIHWDYEMACDEPKQEKIEKGD